MVFKVAINCQQPVGKRTWATSYTTAPSDLIVIKATCMYCNAPQLQGNRKAVARPRSGWQLFLVVQLIAHR